MARFMNRLFGNSNGSCTKQEWRRKRSRGSLLKLEKCGSLAQTVTESSSISTDSDFPEVPAAALLCHQAAASTRVRFNEDKNQEYEAPFAYEDLNDCWYTAKDAARFQQESNATIAEMQRIQAQHPDAEPYERAMMTTYLACVTMQEDDGDSPLDGTELAELQEWIRTCPHFLGLASVAVSSIARNRAFRAQRMRSTILNFPDDDDGFSEEMAAESERISRPSCFFARFLAQVQAEVEVADDGKTSMIEV